LTRVLSIGRGAPSPPPAPRREAGVFQWPVRVQRAGRDAGTFWATFEVPSVARYQQLADAAPAGDAVEVFLREALIGWREINTRDGAPLEFTAEARERLLADPDVRQALMRAPGARRSPASLRPPARSCSASPPLSRPSPQS